MVMAKMIFTSVFRFIYVSNEFGFALKRIMSYNKYFRLYMLLLIIE